MKLNVIRFIFSSQIPKHLARDIIIESVYLSKRFYGSTYSAFVKGESDSGETHNLYIIRENITNISVCLKADTPNYLLIWSVKLQLDLKLLKRQRALTWFA